MQQEPVLFSGTVFENVAKGLLDEQRSLSAQDQLNLVKKACEASNAHDFIITLPEGYDTQLGECAGLLSGGQRQRLAIARSIISNPQVLLLDEATSALDPRAEQIVQSALQRVSQGRTVLVIAHKLATIKDADNVAVISKGVVVEQGKHDELIEMGGQYAALVRAQDLGGGKSGSGSIAKRDDDEETGSNESLQKMVSLKKTESVGRSMVHDLENQIGSHGTVGYSLLRCIYSILKEQR